jgi:hypothetical protein
MYQDYQSIMEQVYFEKKEKNCNYSLRAFARDLNISPSQLSDV